MLNLRVLAPAELTDELVAIMDDDPAVSSLAVVRGAALRPVGDLVFAEVAREAANDVIDRLRELGVHRSGSLQVEPVRTWMSQRGFEAEQLAPGSSADAVVWAEVTQRAYEDSELNWTYLSFMTLATLIAGIAIVLGLPDPGHRRDGAGSGVRCDRGARRRRWCAADQRLLRSRLGPCCSASPWRSP